MNKIPVLKTVAYAYAFTLANLGAIVGLIWIPMLIVTLIGFFAQSTYLDAAIHFQGTRNPADLAPGLVWMLLFVVTALLGSAMMMVPVLEQALGRRQGHSLAHFALGPPEWRMFGAYLTLVGFVLVLVIGIGILGSAVLAAVGFAGGKVVAAASIASLLATVVSIAMFVVVVRLAFFIPAVSVIEEKVDIGRGWSLGSGNTLRMLGVALLAGIPVALIYFGLEVALFGPDSVMPGDNRAPTLEEMNRLRSQMPLSHALGFLMAPLTVGLNAGVVAAAYRAIIPPQTATF
jgi:hypothetical protein